MLIGPSDFAFIKSRTTDQNILTRLREDILLRSQNDDGIGSAFDDSHRQRLAMSCESPDGTLLRSQIGEINMTFGGQCEIRFRHRRYSANRIPRLPDQDGWRRYEFIQAIVLSRTIRHGIELPGLHTVFSPTPLCSNLKTDFPSSWP
jgi:hypothetical protein